MQSNAMRSGDLLQNLGAFLLELGHTTMTLRPPLPFQPGTHFGTTPIGSGISFSVGSGLRPRNIDIRIRIGSVLASASNQREASSGERPAAESAASDGGISNQQATAGNMPQTRGGSDVRVVPIRIFTMPPGLAPPESIRSSLSVLYPVLAQAQHSGNVNGHTSNGNHSENRPQTAPSFEVLQQSPETPEVPGTTHGVLHNGEGLSTEGSMDLINYLEFYFLVRRTMVATSSFREQTQVLLKLIAQLSMPKKHQWSVMMELSCRICCTRLCLLCLSTSMVELMVHLYKVLM